MSKGDTLLVVIVLTHNKRDAVLQCLESVRGLRYRPREVICVDNGSADGSADAVAAAFPEVHLLRSTVNLGAAGGRNLGIRAAAERFGYDYVLFLDDDLVVHERLADELVAVLEADPASAIATPKAYRTGRDRVLASAGGMQVRLGRGTISDIGAGLTDDGQFDRSVTVDACDGFAMLVRREALLRTGGFDDAYNPYGWEEVDFSFRVRANGATIRYAPAAVCWHAGGTPGRGVRVAAYERGKAANYLRLMRRHATPAEWLGFLAVLPVRGLRLAATRLLDGDWRILLAHARGIVEGMRKDGKDRTGR
jgi:GT2 family glycosyltransferase